MTEERVSVRFVWIAVAMGVAMAGLLCRLVYLHLGANDRDRKQVTQTRVYRETLAVPRGTITDASGARNILAVNAGVKDVWVDPAPLVASNRVKETAAQLASVLGVDLNGVEARLDKPGRHFAYVARYVPEDRAAAAARLQLPFVHFADGMARSYPQGNLLCHVLGFVNYDGVGAGGVEQYMNAYLKGAPGLLESALDGRRREMFDRRTQEIPPQDGADVVLTIDVNLQFMVERALDTAMERHRARAAWAILQRIRTGEILAMASRPAFDPNNFKAATDDEKLNRAIGDVYEPGSTFKVGVISGALNEGIVKPGDVFDCENGRWLYQNKILRDYHPYSRLDVADILKKSSNIGAAKIAILLGSERLDRYLRGFNIGSRLGLDLPGEESGILPPLSKWSAISSSRIAIGQGVGVTALQMLGIVCAIANDGRVMKPYVVREVVGNNGQTLLRREPQALGRPIRVETAALMRTLLTRVTEDGGTGVKARVDGFRVAGKTGTAQKVVGGHYSETDYMASFVGFLPADNPDIGLIVVVDDPQPLHTGGTVAAPVFGEVAEQAVRYLGILPPPPAVADNNPSYPRTSR